MNDTTTTTTQIDELRSRRNFVRGIVVIGIGASIGANILGAEDIIAAGIAAWPPIALLLSLEVLTRMPASRRLGTVGRVLATIGVAFAAGWLSYWHMAATVSQHGEHGSSAYVWPISVDGLMTIAAIALVELGARIRQLESAQPVAPVVSDELRAKRFASAQKAAATRKRNARAVAKASRTPKAPAAAEIAELEAAYDLDDAPISPAAYI